MQADTATAAPPLPIRVELSPQIPFDEGRRSALAEAVRVGAGALLGQLGIPGTPTVEVVAGAAALGGQHLAVRASGMLCRYPDELIARIYSAETGSMLQRQVDLPEAARDEGRAVALLAAVCLAILAREPAQLLGPPHAASYAAGLPDAPAGSEGAPIAPEWLLAVLRELLGHYISLADIATIGPRLAAEHAAGATAAAAAEALIGALSRPDLAIHLPRADLRDMTLAERAGDVQPFSQIREWLHDELGMRFPPLRFLPDDSLRPGQFALALNHLRLPAWTGLPRGQVMVNAAADYTRELGLGGEPGFNLSYRYETAVLSAGERARAEGHGMFVWDQLGYLALCVSAELREHAHRLMTSALADRLLGLLARYFPTLERLARERVGLVEVTRLLRGLLVDRVSIRDMRRIAELIVDADYIPLESAERIAFDPRQPSPAASGEWAPAGDALLQYVRGGMKRQLYNRYAGAGTDLSERTMHIFTYNDDWLGAALSEEGQDELVEALWRELRAEPEAQPVLLLSDASAALVRPLLRARFPHLPVLTFGELPGTAQLQPVVWIDDRQLDNT